MTSLLDNVVQVRGSAKSTGGNYLNPSSITENDVTRITLLGSKSLTGYEVWGQNSEGKRVSLKFAQEPSKEDIINRGDEMHVTLQGDEKPRGFYAFAVWNYEDEKVQVFQFSQAGLIDPIINALSDEEIGQEPHAFDFKITTNGQSGLDKRYNVQCVPGKRRQPKIDKQVEAAWDEVINNGFDLSQLLVGADPFHPLF